MDYWDYIPEEERHIVDESLRRALDDDDRPPKDCLKNSMKRLREECGFGIPD
jgi:hypothetical protein